jgi:hypothetical protein
VAIHVGKFDDSSDVIVLRGSLADANTAARGDFVRRLRPGSQFQGLPYDEWEKWVGTEVTLKMLQSAKVLVAARRAGARTDERARG